MNETRINQILDYLTENPFSPIKEISDNASDTKINFHTVKRILEQLTENNVTELSGYYYVIPALNEEIPFLFEIIDNDKFLKPKFRKLNFPRYFSVSEDQFQQILVACILAFYLQIKIRKTELIQSGESGEITKHEIKKIRNKFKNYLKTCKVNKKLTKNDYNSILFTHIINKFESNQSYFKELRVHETSFRNKLKILSTCFRTGSVRTVAGEKTNKNIHKVLKPITKFNLNLDIAKIWFYLEVDERTKNDKSIEKLASKVFFEWVVRIGLSVRTKDDGTPMTPDEIKLYRNNYIKNFKKLFGFSMEEVVDVKSFDTS